MTGASQAGPEASHEYVDKASGRRLRFHPKADEAVVTFRPAGGEQAMRRIAGSAPVRAVSRGVNHERGFAAIFLNQDARTTDPVAVPDAEDLLPVMVDEHGLQRYFLPGELTVQFDQVVTSERAEEIIRQLGSRVLVRQRTPGYFTVATPPGTSLFEAISRFNELPEVVFAEPSEVGFDDALQVRHLPADPLFRDLWGMHNTGQTVNGITGLAGFDIDAPEAWAEERGDREVIVTIIDTGADLSHFDLTPNLLPRGSEDWNFAESNSAVPTDPDGHGTHVAGTAAAAENSFGVIGAAPRCRIMPLRIDLRSGMNQNRADAINYVASQAASRPDRRYVANCSWRTSGDHAGIRTAITNAVNSNVVVVFAAGNANSDMDLTPQFPAVYPTVIAVAALDARGRRATFSNFGSAVDVSAPGVNIVSSVPGGGHRALDGTSMAAPHVAGVAALVWSIAPGLTNQEVRRIVEDTCDSVNAQNPGFAGQLGRGRVNAHQAVEFARFAAGYVPSMPAFA